MLTKFAVALCLFGLALAAEDNSKRNSRQILHPLVPLVGEHHGHSLYSLVQQPHILTPSTINYLPPSGPSVILPQPLSVPFQHTVHHPELFNTHIYSQGPQAFNGPSNQYSHYVPSPSGHYNHNQHYHYGNQYEQNQHNPQGSEENRYSFGRQQGAFRQQSAPVNVNAGESNQLDSSNGSQRQDFLPTSSNSGNGQASFQSLITPSTDSNEEQRFDTGSQLNQNLRGSSQQSSDFSQPQSSGLSTYRPSPRLYGPSPIIAQYPSTQQSGAQGGYSQDSRQSAPNSNQQQTFFQGSFNQQRSGSPDNQQQQNGNGLTTPILSQTGQIRHDGSYTYGFSSANGIQSTESGEMRPEGLSRYVEGSYSYTAPDGTPISAQYYADETGFHVRGDHIPSAPAVEDNSRNYQPGYDQSQRQQGAGPAVRVESN